MENTEQPRVLIVGEAASIHTARFVMMVKSLGYKVRLFSNANNSFQDEHLKDTTVYVPFLTSPARNGNTLTLPWVIPVPVRCDFSGNRAVWISKFTKAFYSRKCAAKRLQRVIDIFKPSLIISLKMQEDGYVVAEAKSAARAFPKWLHFSWGTDIEFFGKAASVAAEHLPKIKNLLSLCDYHIADTMRDAKAAIALGFKGHDFGKQIAQGGFDVEASVPKRTRPFTARRTILVKGRQGGYIGKGMNILEALHGMRDELKGFDIAIILATPDVKEKAEQYSKSDGIDYRCLDKLPYDDIINLYTQARITVSATDVDGSPLFLLETMLLGAMPVHSDMESVREWVTDGENGLLFPVDDIAALQAAIRRGLTDETLFEKASIQNLEIARAEMSSQKIAQETKVMIKKILDDIKDKR